MFFNYLIVVIALSFSLFLGKSFQDYREFQLKSLAYNNWDTMMLAASNRAAKLSSSFLKEFQASLLKSVDSFNNNSDGSKSFNMTFNQDRINLFKSYKDLFLIEDLSPMYEAIYSGLNFVQIENLYENFQVKFYSSTFLNPQFLPSDLSQRATLISPSNLSQELNLDNFYSRFVVNNRIQINSNLLSRLFTEDIYDLIFDNQDLFGLQIVDSGLDIDDLINALSVDVSLKPNPEGKSELLSRYATAQIRLLRSEEEISKSLTVNLFTLPLKNRKFVFDKNQAISPSNPIRIVNRTQGYLSSLHFNSDGSLNMSIGMIATKANGLEPLKDQKKYFNKSTFSNTAVLSNDDSDQNIDEHEDLDIIPRPNARYSVVDNEFKIREFTIPKGFLVVGVRRNDSSSARPKLNEFKTFRVYNPETGFLVGAFSYSDIKRSYCPSSRCLNMSKFYTSKGAKSLGARIYSNFSTKDLFPTLSAPRGVDAWLNVQRDLMLDTVMGINLQAEPWQRRIFKKLSKRDQAYIGHILQYGDTSQINSVFQFTDIPIDKMNSRLKGLYLAQIEALKAYTSKRLNGGRASEIKRLKKTFERVREEFLHYLRYGH